MSLTQRQSSMGINKTKDNVYLNVVINQDSSQGNLSTPAVYNEHLTIPVIDDCSKYYCSIIRFDIPLNGIPILIFPVDVTQNNPNQSSMIIGIQLGGVNFPQHVIYVSTNFEPAPMPGSGPIFFTNSQATNIYYWVFSIANMINMFNTAIRAAVVASGSGLGPADTPFYTFNPVTQLITLTVTAAFIASGSILYRNEQADNYLSSFNSFYHGNNQPGGFEFAHILSPLPPGSPVGGPYVFSEDYVSIDLWFSLRKILITTNSIPILSEYVPSQNPNVFGQNTGINASVPIITDFIPQLEYANQARSIAYYVPPGQYRLVDMISETPLNKINLNVLWEDKFGNLFPVNISIFQQMSIKLAFLKKDLYKNMNLLLRA